MKLRNKKSFIQRSHEGAAPAVSAAKLSHKLFILAFLIVLAYAIYLLFLEFVSYRGDGTVNIDKTLLSTNHYGKITHLPINEGEYVKKGRLLAQLSPATNCATDEQKQAKQKKIAQLEHDQELNQLKLKLISGQIADLTESDARSMLRRALELDDRLLRHDGRILQKLKQEWSLLKMEISLGKEQLEYWRQQQIGNCPDEYIHAPFDGVIKRVFLKVNEFSNRGQGLILIQPEDASVLIHAYVGKTDMDDLAIGKQVEVIFPDNIRSHGVVEEFSSSALTFPEVVRNDYEPVDARISVHIVPVNDDDTQLWKNYDLLRVKIRGKVDETALFSY